VIRAATRSATVSPGRARRALRAVAAALFALACGTAAATCVPDDKLRPILEDSPATGTSIRRAIATTRSVPFDKRYEELTPAQRACLRDAYEAMPDADEPPFPAGGMQVIVGQVASAHSRAWKAGAALPLGMLEVAVKIDSKGRATAVDVYQALDDRPFMALIATVLMTTPYKPAVCGGRPCSMSFPLSIRFHADR
jgi:hypothetical protein